MTQWQIRRAVPDDAAAIVAIFNPIIATGRYTVFDAPFTIGDEADYIASQDERGLFHVAVEPGSNAIVGFQVVDPFAAYTAAFDHVGTIGTYVALDRRRQGIGHVLFGATFDAARGNGFEKLFTFVRSDNPAALQAYLNHGFVVAGQSTRHAKINGHYIDEVIIEKWLLDEKSAQ